MAISKMKKVSVLFLKKDREEVLKKLQAFGNLEFINYFQSVNRENEEYSFLKEENGDVLKRDIEDSIYKIESAINLIQSFEEKESMISSMRKADVNMTYDELQSTVANSSWESKADEIVGLDRKIAEIRENIQTLEQKHLEYSPWRKMESSFGELKTIKKLKVITGRIPNKNEKLCLDSLNETDVDHRFYKVSQYGEYIYFVLICDISKCDTINMTLREYEYEHILLKDDRHPEKILADLESEMNLLKIQLDEKINELSQKVEVIDTLRICKEYYENELLKADSLNNLASSNSTSVLSGWIPAEEEESFLTAINSALDGMAKVQVSEVTEEEIDEVPTKLKNNFLVKPFESITEMYSVPKYNGLDPTPFLAPFYALFFGMMVGDLGYGLIVIIGTLLALKLFNLDEAKRQSMKFFMYLGISTSIWGLIFGAFFGDFIKIPGLISQSDDIFTIMYMSIGFGVIQILVGLILKAAIMIKAKDYLGAFCDVGIWLLTFAFIGIFAVTGNSVYMYLMFAAMAGIVLTNGRDAASIGGKLGGGAYALYGIANYVGDLVSYTRLMALGIAGGSIACAMNLIIGYIPKPAIFIAGPLIFVAAHIFNLALGMLGAYVHGCRLQYVEYFGKFYDGGGKAFTPFKTIDKEIKIKKSEEI